MEQTANFGGTSSTQHVVGKHGGDACVFSGKRDAGNTKIKSFADAVKEEQRAADAKDSEKQINAELSKMLYELQGNNSSAATPAPGVEQPVREWVDGQGVQIYSKRSGAWIVGSVLQQDDESVTVSYFVDGRECQKRVLRGSPHIQPKQTSSLLDAALTPSVQPHLAIEPNIAHLSSSRKQPQEQVSNGYPISQDRNRIPAQSSSSAPSQGDTNCRGFVEKFDAVLRSGGFTNSVNDSRSGSLENVPKGAIADKRTQAKPSIIEGFMVPSTLAASAPQATPAPQKPCAKFHDAAGVIDASHPLQDTPHAGKVGLRNVGNSCFMNTGLQCLSHIKPLAAFFVSGRYLQEVNRTSSMGYGGEMADTFAELQRLLWQKNPPQDSSDIPDAVSQFLSDLRGLFWQSDESGASSAPEGGSNFARSLRTKLSRFAPHLFEGSQQQDAQEFLAFCLDALHEDLNRVVRQPRPASEKQQEEDARMIAKNGDEFAAALAWMRYLERGKSYLVDLLQGQLRSSLTCVVCDHRSQRFDAFLYLSVPVSSRMTSITDAVTKYLEEELLCGEEKWYCEKCNWKVDAKKKIDLWKLPPVLILHLKRFEFDARTFRIRKADTVLSLPGGVLDLSSYCSSEQREGSCYDVVCVANHTGSYNSGHYTATCRVGDAWYVFDDHRVSSLAPGADVVGRDAYVVFLERRKEVDSLDGIPLSGADPLVQSLAHPELWPQWDNLRSSVAGDLRQVAHNRKLLSIIE